MTILLIMLILTFFAVLNSPKIKGYFGELGVRMVLKKLKKEDFEVLHNVLLMKDGKSTQIDHIVVGRTGIFVVETKNYKGWIFGSEHSRFWTQVIHKNNKNRFQNPIHQNYGHIKFLEHHLPDYSGPFFSIISFSLRGTLKRIEVESDDVHVLHSVHLTKVIKSKTVQGMSLDSVRRVAEMIRSAKITDKDAGRKHVNAIKRNLLQEVDDLNHNFCPKCGSMLVEKKGKYGLFKGCSHYPVCRYTN